MQTKTHVPDMTPLAAAQRAAAAALPALMDAFRSTPRDRDAVLAYWRTFFGLPLWLVIARGAQDSPSPFVVVDGDRPTLLVFSSGEGAKETGIAAGLPEAEASLILALPQPDAVDWILEFGAHGVQAVQFDAHLEGGVVVAIAILAAMRADLLGPAPGRGDH